MLGAGLGTKPEVMKLKLWYFKINDTEATLEVLSNKNYEAEAFKDATQLYFGQ